MGRGTFERIELVRPEHLKIGISSPGHLGRLKNVLRDLNTRKDDLSRQEKAIRLVFDAFSRIASETMTEMARGLLESAQEARGDFQAALDRIRETTDAEYRELCKSVASFATSLPEARSREKAAHEAEIEAKRDAENATKHLQSAEEKLSRISADADAARGTTDYDKGFAGEQWDRLLSRFDEDFAGMASHSAEQNRNCDSAARKATNVAISKFSGYQAEYRESPSQEICDDWRLSSEWIAEQVNALINTELRDYRERADEAYRASQEAFRTDVAIALSERFEYLKQTTDRLNAALNCTVLITLSISFTAARTLRQLSCDGAREAKAHAGDRPGEVALHRREPHAGGSLRVGQVL